MECDEIIIAVASSQYNYLKKDPFTSGERMEMIHLALREAGIDPARYMVSGIENQHNVATWAAYLVAALPKFDRVYSGNPYVSMLLADSGITVVWPDFLHRDAYNATAIRDIMYDGGDWQERVPAAVARYISLINGINRIRIISDSDTNPTQH